jgi:hypothetical protein
MFRRPFRRSLRLESLESREMMASGGPSAQAQYMLELINLARTNPQQTADWVVSHAKADPDIMATLDYFNVDLSKVAHDIAGSPARPALAWSDTLAGTATGQSNDQVRMGTQSHSGADGSSLTQRLDNAGYTNRVSAGENAYAYAKSVDHSMEAFLIDWGVASNGHRNNIMEPASDPENFYREVGIGIVKSSGSGVGPTVITQDFGRQANSKAEILGVVYNDDDHDHLYAPGEGVGDVEIDVINASTGATQVTRTWDAGGYQVAVNPGTYSVVARVNGQVVNINKVTVGDQNVKVDYDLSDPWRGGTVADNSGSPSTPVAAKQQDVVTSGGTADTNTSFQTSWVSWTASKK